MIILRMSYSKAVRGFQANPAPSIQSTAETELKRKLTSDELQTLSEKFSLETVTSHIQKVII